MSAQSIAATLNSTQSSRNTISIDRTGAPVSSSASRVGPRRRSLSNRAVSGTRYEHIENRAARPGKQVVRWCYACAPLLCSSAAPVDLYPYIVSSINSRHPPSLPTFRQTTGHADASPPPQLPPRARAAGRRDAARAEVRTNLKACHPIRAQLTQLNSHRNNDAARPTSPPNARLRLR